MLNQMIDHTLLKPEATQAEIQKLCSEAREFQFACVCVQPYWVSYCVNQLLDTQVKTCTVVGFPLGVSSTASKLADALWALESGATEVDMVLNIAAVKNQNWELVENDIHALSELTHKHHTLLKVILETCLLTDAEIEKCCLLAKKAGANFVKTSTGFSTGGATIEDVKLMRKAVGDKMGIKASGGIRDTETALRMIESGATRLGTSSGVKIMQKERGESFY